MLAKDFNQSDGGLFEIEAEESEPLLNSTRAGETSSSAPDTESNEKLPKPGPEEKGGMRTWDAVLSIIATVLGAGLVFIPHAVYQVGIPMGMIIQVFSAALSFLSCTLYMKAQKMVPFPVETLYDLGYIVMRTRVIVFFIAVLLLTSCTGCSIIYLILFGDTMASIMKQAVRASDDYPILAGRTLYVLIISGFLGPLLFKRHLNELTIVSVVLALAFITFLAAFIYQLAALGTSQNPDYNGEEHVSNMSFQMNIHIIACVSLMLNAMAFQANLFPLYESLGGKPEKRRN